MGGSGSWCRFVSLWYGVQGRSADLGSAPRILRRNGEVGSDRLRFRLGAHGGTARASTILQKNKNLA